MGIKQASQTRYIYEIHDNFTFKQTEYYVTFEDTVFEEGTFRYVYKGIIKNKEGKPTKPDLFPNEKCTVKIYKNKEYDANDFIKDLNNYYYSRNVSSIFNLKYKDLKFIPKFNYIPTYVTSLEKYSTYNLFYFFPIRDSDQMKKIKEKEWITIEPFLGGKFEKFINNNCIQKYGTDESIVLFMHWNWVYSKGKSLICDIQGEEKYYSYELTDPAVQSIDKEYGESDLGPCSLINFLINHQHNELCKDLPWPNMDDMDKLNELRHDMYIIQSSGAYSYCKNYKNLYQEIIDSTFNKTSSDSGMNIPIILFIIIVIFLILLIIFRRYMKKRKKKEKQLIRLIPMEEV